MRGLILLTIALFFCEAKSQDSIGADSTIQAVTDSLQDIRSQEKALHNPVYPFEIKPVKSTRQPVWLFLIFLFQLMLIAYLRLSFSKMLDDMFKAVMNLNIASQLYREQQQTTTVSAILFNVIFILSGGIFLFLINQHFGWMSDNSIVSMLFFLWAVIVLYSLRYGIFKFVALVFPFGNELEQYNFNFFLVQKFMGLALVLFNLMIAYAPEEMTTPLIIAALIIVVLLIIGRTIKGLAIARNLMTHYPFHFFVYICTLEIAPLCILVKVVVDG